MSSALRAHPGNGDVDDVTDGRLILHGYPEGDCYVVQVTGELDDANRNHLFVASTAGNHPVVVIDLADVTFMDCSGYGCLVASRLAVEREGRSLITRGRTGQPARLYDLIAALELDPRTPIR